VSVALCLQSDDAEDASDEEEGGDGDDEPVDEEEAKDRKLQADIEAAVQKELSRERRLKKTVRTAAVSACASFSCDHPAHPMTS
jgi:hypothetical protein